MKRHFYILKWGNSRKLKDDYSWNMWQEVENRKGITLSSVPKIFRSNKAIDFHGRFFRYTKRIWYYIYLWGSRMDCKEGNVVLINDSHPCLINKDFIDYLKYKKKCTIVVYFLNQIADKDNPMTMGKGRGLEELKKQVDLIVTADYADSCRFGLSYIPDPYSKILNEKSEKITTDLYYFGLDKNRGKILSEIGKLLKRNNIEFSFGLVSYTDKIRKVDDINYVNKKSYKKILEETMQSNCILELVEENQSAATLRYMEAICYNKKLISNNKNIKNFKCYDERYMRVFEDISDIEIDFIKRKEKVSYNYQGEYSPEKYIRKVIKLLNKCKKISL